MTALGIIGIFGLLSFVALMVAAIRRQNYLARRGKAFDRYCELMVQQPAERFPRIFNPDR